MSISKVICDDIIKAHDIHSVFGVPGAYSIHLIDRIANTSRLEYILTSHEAGAAFAAQAYGQVRKGFGVCITTAGPAVTNCVSALLSAKGDGDSVLFIHGEIPLSSRGKGYLQDFSTLHSAVSCILAPVCYTQHLVTAPHHFSSHAILEDLSHSRGAVDVQVDSNIFASAAPELPLQPSKPTHVPSALCPQADENSVALVRRAIMADDEVVLCFVGHGVYRTAMPALDAFLRQARIPVMTTARGVACVDHALDTFVGQFSIFPHQSAVAFLETLQAARVHATLLCLGTSLGEFGTCGYHPLLNETFRTIIHVDQDPSVFGRLGGISQRVDVLADLNEFLHQLCESLGTQPLVPCTLQETLLAGTQAVCRYSRFDELLSDQVVMLSGQRVAYQLGQALQSYDRVNIVADTGSSKLYAAHYIPYRPNWKCIMNSGVIDCLGFGLSAAIGACRASYDMGESDTLTVAFLGDGGVLMNNELNTLASAAMKGLPLLVFVLNDSALSYVHQGFAAVMGRPLKETRFASFVDFQLMAQAFGIHTEVVEDGQTINKAFLARLVALQSPVVVDCRLREPCIGPGLERYNHVRRMIGKDELSSNQMAQCLIEHQPEEFHGGGPNRMHLYGIIYDVFRGCIDPLSLSPDNAGVMPELSFGLGVSSFARDLRDIGDAVYFNGRFFVRRTDEGEARQADGAIYSEGDSRDYRTCYSIGVASLEDMADKEYIWDDHCSQTVTMRDLLTRFVGPERTRGEPGRIYGFMGLVDYEAFLGTSLSKPPTQGENILPVVEEYARPSIPRAHCCGVVMGFVRTVVEDWDSEYAHALYERMFFDNPRDNDGTQALSVEMGTYWISHTHGVLLQQDTLFPDAIQMAELAADEGKRNAWLQELLSRATFDDCGHVIPSSSLKRYFFIKFPVHHVDVFNPPLQVGLSTLDDIGKKRMQSR